MSDPVPAGDARTPLRFGSYVVRGELGRGGQAVVYDAVDERLNRRVALKVLEGIGPAADAAVRRLRREVAVLSRLEHPAICAVYEADFAGDTAWIAMRRVEGGTLAELLARRGASAGPTPGPTPRTLRDPLAASEPSLHFDRSTLGRDAGDPASPPAATAAAACAARFDASRLADPLAVAELFEKLARALDVAHAAGVVHRDVKPGNVMVTPEGEPVLLDFGLAASIDETPGFETLTRTNVAVGTPAYMSPEQCRGARLDGRTDVFSLGVALYETLTGRRPFEGPTRQALASAILARDPEDPRRLAPGLSKDLAATTLVALEKDLGRRYATARDFADDLRRVRAGEPVRARTPGPLERCARFARRRPAVAALLVAALIGLPTTAALLARIDALAPRAAEAAERAAAEARETELGLAFLEVSEGRADAATALFARALRDDPAAIEARAGAALAALRAGRAEDALRLLDEAPGGGTPTRAFALLRADALRASGRSAEAAAAEAGAPPATSAVDAYLAGEREIARAHSTADVRTYSEALRRFEEAVATTPHARALYHYGVAHAATHAEDRRAAGLAARTIGRLWPDATTGLFWRGYAMQLVDEEEAVRLFRAFLARRPEALHCRVGLCRALIRLGRRQEARREAEAALGVDPRNTSALDALAQTASALGDGPAAVDALRRAVAVAPADAPLGLTLAAELRKLGRNGEAVDALRALRAAYGDRGDADTARIAEALVYELELAGRPADAEAECRAAAESRPYRASARSEYGRLLFRRKRWDEARRELAAAVEIDPRNADDLRYLGFATTYLGDRVVARGLLEAAVAAGDATIETARQLAIFYADEGRAEDEIAARRRVVALRPDDAAARAGLSIALNRLGRGDEALAAIDEAPNLDYGGVARQHRAILCAWFDRFEDAERIARTNFDDPARRNEALVVAAYALTRRGRFEEAVDLLEEVRERPTLGGFMAYDAVRAIAEAGERLPSDPAGTEPIGPAHTEAGMLALRAAGRPDDAVRLFWRLRTVEPNDVGDPQFAVGDAARGLRLLAARCAMAAASAEKDVVAAVDWRERARLLLAEDRTALVAAPKLAPTDRSSHLRRRIGDPAFAPVRDAAATERLGPEERLAWRTLWRDYRAAAGVRD